MSELAAVIPAQRQQIFLCEEDLLRMRQEADEVDAAYGEGLDPLALALLVRLSEGAQAA
jgi:hypothetical protein